MILRTAARFGIEATTCPRYTGVWVGNDKLAAIGVRMRQGVTYHRCTLNVDLDLSYFGAIVPCGIPDQSVASLAPCSVTLWRLRRWPSFVPRHLLVSSSYGSDGERRSHPPIALIRGRGALESHHDAGIVHARQVLVSDVW